MNSPTYFGDESWALVATNPRIPVQSKAALRRVLKGEQEPIVKGNSQGYTKDDVIVRVLATVGNEFEARDMTLTEVETEMPGNGYLILVGPNPYRDRRWIGQLRKRNGTLVVL
jgi:hypothetical protein